MFGAVEPVGKALLKSLNNLSLSRLHPGRGYR